MSVEDQFDAAVQIIRSLPKNGRFHPPYALQLTFYSYYKQATEGPCTGSRPSFWDVAARVKFDAWNGLGTMTKAEAMEKYVNDFVTTIKQLQRNATPDEVKEALSYAKPKHIALFRPLFGDVTNVDLTNIPSELRTLAKTDNGGSVMEDTGRHSEDDIEKLDNDHDTDGEEYSDTFNHIDNEHFNNIEQAEIITDSSVHYGNIKNNNNNNKIVKAGGGDPNNCPPPPMAAYMGFNREPFSGASSGMWLSGNPLGLPGGKSSSEGRTYPVSGNGGGRRPSDANAPNGVQPVDNLSYAVVRLQYTMDEVIRRLDNLERTLQEHRRMSRWSLLGGVQPHVLAAIIFWPLLVQFVMYLIHRRRLRVQLRLK
ncbi:hypothetical protein BIW11_02170 [Tropilaelaps mercedesae]|uniref:ACB domain-containing protein n=1 Tax=Tropilaelaps mercedesae TaxID=418985 RepID=A0A1V9X1Q3_9ACAR|nr:hypothetical protein BIW11_02170 [Tropilaelaps mercedesae]